MSKAYDITQHCTTFLTARMVLGRPVWLAGTTSYALKAVQLRMARLLHHGWPGRTARWLDARLAAWLR